MNSHLNNDVIQCKRCQSDIGNLNEKDVFFSNLASHSAVVLNKKMFKLKVSKTFLLLIGGICAEHDWI